MSDGPSMNTFHVRIPHAGRYSPYGSWLVLLAGTKLARSLLDFGGGCPAEGVPPGVTRADLSQAAASNGHPHS
ncbi:MAG: hypothetical protein ACRD7E_26950 [Bryobacteraceae bacterium]